MPALPLSQAQAAVINNQEADLEQAFLEGLSSNVVPSVDLLQFYNTFDEPTKKAVKLAFKATTASLLTAISKTNLIETNLTLTNGYIPSGNSSEGQGWKISKDWFGNVTIRGVVFSTANLASNTVVAVLPIEYRPSLMTRLVAVAVNTPCSVRVEANGELRIQTTINNGDYIDINVSYRI